MFRRKKGDGEDDGGDQLEPPRRNSDLQRLAPRPPLPAAGTAPPAQPVSSTQPNRSPMMPPRPTAPDLNRSSTDLLRRPSELGGAPATGPSVSNRGEAEVRQLIVGREIGLSGEIKACDRLIVEGSVEANLANCQDVNIAESGLFRGSASIDDAEIRGRFEGTLTVRNRLFIRATGKVTGTVRYGQIEIECGGQISGDVQAQPGEHVEAAEPKRERAPQAVVDLGPSRVA